MNSIWTPESNDNVRFYFNYMTGAIDHTGNNSFLLNADWIFIGIFIPSKTKLSAKITADKTKWNIYNDGKFHVTHYMTEPQIAAYEAYVVKQVTKLLRK